MNKDDPYGTVYFELCEESNIFVDPSKSRRF
jgi:hypothetical protein